MTAKETKKKDKGFAEQEPKELQKSQELKEPQKTQKSQKPQESQELQNLQESQESQELQNLQESQKSQELQEPQETKKEKDDERMYIDPVEDALNAKETLFDMAVGLIVCAAVIAVVGSIFVGQAYRFVLGVLLGAAVAGLMLRHLYVSLDRALDMDEEHASKYMKKSAVLRILMAGAGLLLGALFPKIFHIFGIFIGLLCLKFTAYLQPLTHKVIKILSKGR